jgi:two-component system, OmpR family, response regulator
LDHNVIGQEDFVRVLVVEDEARLSQQLANALGEAGYAVDCAADGERADFLGQTERYDAVVLDLGLPKIDGLTVLHKWREAGIQVPVLVLTARGSWHEKVQGIDGGADDYMAKPFRMEEVLARLRALIRRSSGQVTPELRCGALALDTRTARLTMDGVPVKLTSHEFRVLSYLMHHRGRVVPQSELTEHIYAQNFDRDSNTVEVFVARLRRKLGSSVIETVRGLGYRIQAEQ